MPPSTHRRFRIAAALSCALGATACNDAELGNPLPERHSEIHYQGGQAPPVDVLFVVDNSGSMQQEQTKLAANFQSFIQYFQNLGLDFQLAVVTTDVYDPSQSGRFVGNPKILKSTTADLAAAFQSNVNVGTDGSGVERGLEAARLALSEPLASGENAGFLRPDSILAIVVVSDEEDGGSESNAPVQDPVSEYVSFFLSLRGGDPSKVNLSAIAGDVPSGCSSEDAEATPAYRYAEAVNALNGAFGSICADDFGPILDQIGNTISGLATAFPTQYTPVVESIVVEVDGVEVPRDGASGWQWNETIGGVAFAPPAVPPECAVIEIRYQVADYGGPIENGNNEAAPEQCPLPLMPGSNSLDGGAFECSVSGLDPASDAAILRLLLVGLVAAGATLGLRRRAR